MDLFQSLIGRLKTTVEPREGKSIYSGFQSLIGRLKTQRDGNYEPNEKRVSIPHR